MNFHANSLHKTIAIKSTPPVVLFLNSILLEFSRQIMILLSPQLLRVFRFFINYAYFFRVVPCKYCKTRNRIYYVETTRWEFYKWDVIKYVILAHQLFIIIRFLQSVTATDSDDLEADYFTKYIYITEFVYLCLHLFVTILQIGIMIQGPEAVKLLNQFITFSIKFQGKN